MCTSVDVYAGKPEEPDMFCILGTPLKYSHHLHLPLDRLPCEEKAAKFHEVS
jgi:hypothetical protein